MQQEIYKTIIERSRKPQENRALFFQLSEKLLNFAGIQWLEAPQVQRETTHLMSKRKSCVYCHTSNCQTEDNSVLWVRI